MLRCQQQGLTFALDDLGAGYSSMRDLCDYPVNFVKIDRSITLRAEKERGFAILKGMIDTVHAMGLEALCEGVETEEQRDTVIRAGCDYIQGFYFSRVYPIPEGMEHYFKSLA